MEEGKEIHSMDVSIYDAVAMLVALLYFFFFFQEITTAISKFLKFIVIIFLQF